MAGNHQKGLRRTVGLKRGQKGGTSTVMVLNAAAEDKEAYFKPHFAQRLQERLAAPSDSKAPEGEQDFIDWLNIQTGTAPVRG